MKDLTAAAPTMTMDMPPAITTPDRVETLYDTETRTMIQNPANDSARSGLDTLETNPDGSVDLYFGPAGSAPAGLEANWIETFPGKGFYPMFRMSSWCNDARLNTGNKSKETGNRA